MRYNQDYFKVAGTPVKLDELAAKMRARLGEQRAAGRRGGGAPRRPPAAQAAGGTAGAAEPPPRAHLSSALKALLGRAPSLRGLRALAAVPLRATRAAVRAAIGEVRAARGARRAS